MEADYFGSIYIECERAGDQVGWLRREGISVEAWLAGIDLMRREIRDAIESGQISGEEALDAVLASAMQVAWVGGIRWAANSHPEPHA